MCDCKYRYILYVNVIPTGIVRIKIQIILVFNFKIYYYMQHRGSRDSSVSIATRYGLEGPGIESRWGEIFRTYPDWLRRPPSLLYNGYRVFPGGKRRSGRDTGHSPPSSAEVNL